MQKLFDGVFMLEGEVGGRPLQLMHLRGKPASILLDTGCTNEPAGFIIPQMREAGGDPAHLTWIIVTHSDLDHIGGNHQMKQHAPQAILVCGDADVALAVDVASSHFYVDGAYHLDDRPLSTLDFDCPATDQWM